MSIGVASLRRALLVVAGSFVAWGFWLGEVCWIKGWAGLVWLSGFNWSALPICAVIVALCGRLMNGSAPCRARLKFFGAGLVASVAAFVLERFVAFELFSGGAPAALTIGIAGAFVLGVALVPVVLVMASKRWLAPTSHLAMLYLGGALFLVLPLSFATIHVVPAVNGSTDEIHAIKMGYPVFWTALLVPAALRLGKKNRRDVA